MVKEYRRYGPAEERIFATEGPETRVTTTKVSFDLLGRLVAFETTVSREDGTILQRATKDNDEINHENRITGEAKTVRGAVEDLNASQLSARWRKAEHHKRAAIDGAQVVARKNGTVTIRTSANLPSVTTDDGASAADAYTIPYVADLDVASSYQLVTIEESTTRTLLLQIHVVTTVGADIIVERREVIEERFQ